jgi:RNA polymerase sigma factor (sigma-70 family)
MSGKQPYLPREDGDERAIIEEMIRNPEAKNWEVCREFITRCVYRRADNIPREYQEEIIQEICYRVAKSLPLFRFESTFKTWLNTIIGNCIVNKHRELGREEKLHVPLADPFDENERDDEERNRALATRSTEETFELGEKIRHGMQALLEYSTLHSHPDRDRHIIRMILDGHTQVEAAESAGCDSAVAGHVMREAQKYAREMWKKIEDQP